MREALPVRDAKREILRQTGLCRDRCPSAVRGAQLRDLALDLSGLLQNREQACRSGSARRRRPNSKGGPEGPPDSHSKLRIEGLYRPAVAAAARTCSAPIFSITRFIASRTPARPTAVCTVYPALASDSACADSTSSFNSPYRTFDNPPDLDILGPLSPVPNVSNLPPA